MKKLFVYVMASLCSTFAFADADLVVKNASISGGTGTMEVVINKANTTAFQFDLKLPTGISATGFTLTGAPSTRQFENAVYNAETNTYRFLSYDNENAALSEGATFNIALAAADGASAGEAESEGILLVDPDGASTEVEGATAVVSLGSGIEIPAGGKLMMVSSTALDFSTLEAQGLKAYVCTGYEVESKTFWMARVNDVPANTPILVKGTAGNYDVPAGSSNVYYPQSFLYGSATSDGDDGKYAVVTADGYTNYAVSKTKGTIGSYTGTRLNAGTAYFHVPSDVTSNVSSSKVHFDLKAGGKMAVVSDYDLDFTDMESQNLKAYTVTAFSKDRTIWLSRVMKAPAYTPLVLHGDANGSYDVPSVASKIAYVNMLNGNTSSDAVHVSQPSGDNWIFVLSLSKGKWGELGSSGIDFAKGKAWLPVPTSYVVSASARGENLMVSESEAEMISITLESLGGDGDDTTGIRTIEEAQSANDVWYNLNGQRIDTPTKKGLYIKNGKKILVK